MARALADIGAIDETALRAALEEGLQVAANRPGEFRCGWEIHRLPSRHRLPGLIRSRCRFSRHGVGGSSEPLAKTANVTGGGRQSIWFGAGARHGSDTGVMDVIHSVFPGGQDGCLNSSTPLDQGSLGSNGRHVQLPLSLD